MAETEVVSSVVYLLYRIIYNYNMEGNSKNYTCFGDPVNIVIIT